MKHGDYSDGFHTYGLEWSENYLYTYVDNRLVQSLYVPFGASYGSMYERGGYTTQNPWFESTSSTKNAPFDQAFYLILNVAVGSTSNYFPDEIGSKPWSNKLNDSHAAVLGCEE
ncbi:beta-1,3-glucan-binding protein [Seiridium cupressi]